MNRKNKKLQTYSPMVSSQVVSEYFNVMKRKFPSSKNEVFDVCIGNIDLCELYFVKIQTLRLAQKLVSKYDFQIFDGIIVAAAPEAGCETLYSEDFYNGLLVENRLKIINPFL